MITVEEIKQQALKVGWDDVGVTAAHVPEEDIASFRQWLKKQYHANLQYMENQLRCFPQQFFPGAQTAIIFVTYYKQTKQDFRQDAGLIASYARGRDYHNVHRKRLKKFIRWLEERSGKKNIARGFTDSAPVLEKALAVQAGLGWFGKNTLLIHRKFGTFTLLSGLFTSLEIPTKTMSMRLPRCGSCTKCIDACPTQALVSPYQLDAGRCLSYHLIESKQEIPVKVREQNPGYIFGCDICQDVCPHNARKQLSQSPYFQPEKGMGVYITPEEVDQMQEHPEKLYGTPLTRKGVRGLRQNIESIFVGVQSPRKLGD